jgi:large subunit ribosomal protein L10e|tara:strand:- start:61 stop:633 length:573 start_codon:yes stop_codon:yes gene_type:complete
MARIRRFSAYRKLERPYTRISKFKKKSFIKASPHKRIVKFVSGNTKKTYPVYFHLHSKRDLQIRDNALESARMTANRTLERELGQKGYFFQVRKYPHHVLRENPLASGAGADRFSTGMQKAFGKPIGNAIRVKKGDVLFTAGVPKSKIAVAKLALSKAGKKLPCSTQLIQEIKELPKKKPAPKKEPETKK